MKRILPLLLLALASAPAFATPEQPVKHGGGHVAQLQKADANGDGAISRDEFAKFRAAQFDRRDTNKDGFITAADKPARADAKADTDAGPGRFMKAADTNGDGKISRDEFVSGGGKMFDRLDANKDGVIAKAEFDAAKAKGPAH
jgi:Ca2+-binding EF-hand superfamily protein